MYSGTDGVEMKAEIFFGIVHYQRLRHMVSDKFQVRNQGPIDQVRVLNSILDKNLKEKITINIYLSKFWLSCFAPIP